MNLYIFNKTSKAAVFGIGTYINELTDVLRHSNLRLCVIDLCSDKPQILMEEISGVKYWYLPKPRQEKWTTDEEWTTDTKKQLKLYYRNVVYVLQLNIEDKKDLIFHLNFMDFKPLMDSLRTFFECKIVLAVHYLNSYITLLGNISRLRRIISQTDELTHEKELTAKAFFLQENELFNSTEQTCSSSSRIICLSNFMYDFLLRDYGVEEKRITVIPNGLHKEAFTNASKKVLRKKWKIPTTEKIILFVGRFDEVKGLSYLIKAFRLTLEKFPNCRLMIAGNGQFDTYMKECEDVYTNVTWTGFLNKQKLHELYSIADIGVMPSFHEQCSYVAIEMMRHGLPIIGSTSTGLKEMVIDGETGLHIPVIEDYEKAEIDTSLLSDKILHLLQHPNERQRLGKNARKRYKEVYSKEVFRRNMLKFYKSLR
jgi:glycosyltransferase